VLSPCGEVFIVQGKRILSAVSALFAVAAAALIASQVYAAQTTTSDSLTVEHDRVQTSAKHHYSSPAERALDDRIIAEVKSEIAHDGISDRYPVAVDCDHGTVLLSGVVKSAQDASRAARDASEVRGVVAVRSRLTWR
jgi:osmotically-inducible protein OsmY